MKDHGSNKPSSVSDDTTDQGSKNNNSESNGEDASNDTDSGDNNKVASKDWIKAIHSLCKPWSFDNKRGKVASETDVEFVESLHLMSKKSMTATDVEVGESPTVDKSPKRMEHLFLTLQAIIIIGLMVQAIQTGMSMKELWRSLGKNTIIDLKQYLMMTQRKWLLMQMVTQMIILHWWRLLLERSLARTLKEK